MAIGASIVYALVFEPLGYVFSTILYLGAVLFIVNGKARVRQERARGRALQCGRIRPLLGDPRDTTPADAHPGHIGRRTT
jgi:hypothetical protein